MKGQAHKSGGSKSGGRSATSHGRTFKVANTGRSPIASMGIVHNSTGANVPASYAHQASIVSRIASKTMKKGSW